MSREEAVQAALAALDARGFPLESRTPAEVEENVRLIHGRNSRGWRNTFDVPEAPIEYSFVSVEIYEPSGQVYVIPML